MDITDSELIELNFFLKTYTDYDLTDYSDKSLKRRIDKILEDYKINFKGLLFKIKNSKEFADQIIKDITVNTTELFRDPKNWHCIKYKILPVLANNQSINIWHAGSSTGQEVYSMLILLKELNLFDKTNIYASDINTDVIEQAKKGEYKYRFNLNYLDNFDDVIKKNPCNFDEFNDVKYEKYFAIDKKYDVIIMNKELREKIKWAQNDLVKSQNPFYIKFDLIMCRNVLIYFNTNLQNKTLKLFNESLKENAFLMLGDHESVIGLSEAFFSKKNKYYIKK